jgi:hypothetical protein
MIVLDELARIAEARFAEIYASLARDGYGPLDGELAKLLKFRPQAMVKLPMDQRARRARAYVLGKKNAELAYELLGGYLLAQRRALVTGFLDKTGVKHQDGMLDDSNALPDRARIEPALAELEKEFGAEDVTSYLALCTQHWPELPELAAIWRRRTGPQIGTA